LARIVADFCGGARRFFAAFLQKRIYFSSISKVKQGGNDRTMQTVRLHGYKQRLGYGLLKV